MTQTMLSSGILFQHLAFVLDQQSEQILQEQLGIGYSQYKILMMVDKHPRLQQNRIADSLGQTEASISRQIKLLLDKDFITSRISPKNRRRHVISLTPKGAKITTATTELLKEQFKDIFGVVPEKQFARFQEDLASLHNSICKDGAAGSCSHIL